MLGGDLAAAEWGAPIVVGDAFPPDLYAPTPAAFRRIMRSLTKVPYEERGATIAVAPSPVVTQASLRPPVTSLTMADMPLAHPVVIALDLAQDAARGREILDLWDPEGVERVW